MKLRELLPNGIYSIKSKKDNDEYYDNLMDYILDNAELEELTTIWEAIENCSIFKELPKFYKDKTDYYTERPNLQNYKKTMENKWYE